MQKYDRITRTDINVRDVAIQGIDALALVRINLGNLVSRHLNPSSRSRLGGFPVRGPIGSDYSIDRAVATGTLPSQPTETHEAAMLGPAPSTSRLANCPDREEACEGIPNDPARPALRTCLRTSRPCCDMAGANL